MLAEPQTPDALPRQAFSTLERILVVRSDSQEILDYFRSAYRRVLAPVPADTETSCDFGSILAHSGANWLYFNGELVDYPEEKPATIFRLAFYGSSKLVRLSFRRNPAWRSLYAAALQVGDRAIIVSAPSGIGKTTLALELLARGARFYTDEFVFVRKSDCAVSGLPRALLIRERTLSAFRDERLRKVCEASTPRTQYGDRVWDNIDPGDVFGEDIFAKPAPLAAAIILERGTGQASVERIPAALAAADFVRRLNAAAEGFERLVDTTDMLSKIPCYRVAASSARHAASAIESLLRSA